MRIRSTSLGLALLWMTLATVQIVTAILRYHRHLVTHRMMESNSFDISMIGVWSLIFLLYVYQLVFSRVAFDTDRLRIYNGIGHTSVRYNTIIAIRRAWLGNGKPIPNAVELEIARIDPAIYPHQYLVLRSANSTALADAVHRHVPQATYDVA